MSGVQAELNIELNVNCPHCDADFDLFEIDDGRLNEEGWLIQQACPNGYWGEKHEQFKTVVKCPECRESIEINGIG